MKPNATRLREEIVARSQSTAWDVARLEWSLSRIEFADDPETCLCGHWPIVELCYLGNRLNGSEALVGNVCVTKFFDLGSNLVFDGLRRVIADDTRPLNDAAIDFSVRQGWVNSWEDGFLRDTARKRVLSARQAWAREGINRRIIQRVRRGPSP